MEREFFFDYLMKNPAQLLDDNDSREVKELDKQITTAETKLNTITKQLTDAAELIGVVAVDELKVKMTKLEKDRETVKGQLDTLNIQRSKIQDASHNFHDIQKLFFPRQDLSKLNDPEYIKETAKKVVLRAQKGLPMKHKILKEVVTDMSKQLSDEYVREGVRVMLPSLIGKITVQTWKGGNGGKCGAQFYVYNRMGKLVYQSTEYDNRRNNSAMWKEKVRAGVLKYWAKKGYVNGKKVK